MIKKFNEMKMDMTQNVYVTLHNGNLAIRDLYIQYQNGKPWIAHDGRGLGGIFYKFALTYDDMITKFVTNDSKRKRLKIIKDDFIDFLEKRRVGTKIYIKDIYNGTDDYLECVWDGKVFSCGVHIYFEIDGILNNPIWFEMPDKNIIKSWSRNGHRWSDKLKSWIKN